MDIILSFLAKSLDRHGITLVHIPYPPLAVSGNVFLPKYDLSFTQKSITFSGANLWNEIPVSIKKALSLDSFKYKLKAYYLQIQNETQ